MCRKMSSTSILKGSKLDSEYHERLSKKLSLIEELREELGREGIQCPGVIAIGAQSSGKSSVLEQLTGISFPSAESTCTRVPTIVQLQTDPEIDHPFVLISKMSNFEGAVRCSDLSIVKDEISKCSAEITERTQEPVSDNHIHISYTRMRGPVMTLIDLPGITHVDVRNDIFDIHKATTEMVKKYSRNDDMVMLVVIPANDDFGNSEALRIARKI